jgi:hypothetical protein
VEKKPESVMYFNEVKSQFVEQLQKYLKKSKADLFTVDLNTLLVSK